MEILRRSSRVVAMGISHRKSAADVDHRPRRFQESRLTDVVAGFLPLDGLDNVGAQFLFAGAGAEAAVEVVLDLRKEARANLAVGGETHPAACAAKRLAHRRNNSDLTDAICKCIAPGGFAGFPRRELDQRQSAADAFDNLRAA